MRSEPTITQPRIARTAFGAVTTTPAAARSFVRHTMRTWGYDEDIDTAELIVSELVTNAVKAATKQDNPHSTDLRDMPMVGIELQSYEQAIRIAVQDSNHEQPTPRVATDDAENGRGLLLVQALCRRWDVDLQEGGGKVVWVELALAKRDEVPVSCRP
ncbi:ATP-binding protein [Streptomyces sp.]|uniref:ATP-binding protein n=1 Tax=Streptomyces sp. TaxID=1931 RepID=UPI002F3F0DBE